MRQKQQQQMQMPPPGAQPGAPPETGGKPVKVEPAKPEAKKK